MDPPGYIRPELPGVGNHPERHFGRSGYFQYRPFALPPSPKSIASEPAGQRQSKSNHGCGSWRFLSFVEPILDILRNRDAGEGGNGAGGAVRQQPAAPPDPIAIVWLIFEILPYLSDGFGAVQAGRFQKTLSVEVLARKRFRELQQPIGAS